MGKLSPLGPVGLPGEDRDDCMTCRKWSAGLVFKAARLVQYMAMLGGEEPIVCPTPCLKWRLPLRRSFFCPGWNNLFPRAATTKVHKVGVLKPQGLLSHS